MKYPYKIRLILIFLFGVLYAQGQCTYTYTPQVGVRRITDPSGNYTNYEYDGLDRLERTKDRDSNLLTDHQYHYKNQN